VRPTRCTPPQQLQRKASCLRCRQTSPGCERSDQNQRSCATGRLTRIPCLNLSGGSADNSKLRLVMFKSRAITKSKTRSIFRHLTRQCVLNRHRRDISYHCGLPERREEEIVRLSRIDVASLHLELRLRVYIRPPPIKMMRVVSGAMRG